MSGDVYENISYLVVVLGKKILDKLFLSNTECLSMFPYPCTAISKIQQPKLSVHSTQIVCDRPPKFKRD